MKVIPPQIRARTPINITNAKISLMVPSFNYPAATQGLAAIFQEVHLFSHRKNIAAGPYQDLEIS